ncbi:hypothetical protein Bhyg_05268, partial [Pseudolycoriella hygida]
MDEEGICEDIYGDLGDFEAGEKHSQEIANLNEQLKQSANTIADLQNEIKKLKKESREVEKNFSSLLQTARLEINRKNASIATLQQQNDNRIFRRSRKISIGTQTDPMQTNVHTEAPVHIDIKNGNATEPNMAETCNNTSDNINKFRIPKKNPFARNENMNGTKSTNSTCVEKIENSYDHPRHHLPKKNPKARCLGTDKLKTNFTNEDRYACKEPDGEKTRPRNRSEDMRDIRKSSHRAIHTHRDKKIDFDNQYRHKRSRRSSRHRSASYEADRHLKRRRSYSTSSSRRSRSKSTRSEERRSQKQGPKETHHKPKNNVGVESLKENDLEALLIAQKKVLNEIISEDSRKAASNETDELKEPKNEEITETLVITCDDILSTNKATDNIAVIKTKLQDNTEVTAEELLIDSNDIAVVKTELEDNIEATVDQLPIDSKPEISSTNISTSSSVLEPLVEPEKSLAQIEEPAQLPHSTEPNNEANKNQSQCDGTSNEEMDIDVELSERRCVPIANINDTNEPLRTQVNASIIALENHNTVEDSETSNKLNSSFERHILSKSREYTVEDAGHEIRIFLTKKRKKNKSAKATT